ncbi:hypothetical protein B0I32_117234 [Nonomuraea fuscirosea]|uniref:Uncharacterized protein n=1 Tax=Nonomuraea fuscirosea TaxID=1291556 RepID=A0A2T0MQU4_9ACTN|nr:hypothetical protein B0I32_117234 [Nonomuraea fuscirosea]
MWANVCDEDASKRRNSKVIPSECPDKNVYGKYSFALPQLPGGRRQLRDPDAAGDEDDDEEGA